MDTIQPAFALGDVVKIGKGEGGDALIGLAGKRATVVEVLPHGYPAYSAQVCYRLSFAGEAYGPGGLVVSAYAPEAQLSIAKRAGAVVEAAEEA